MNKDIKNPEQIQKTRYIYQKRYTGIIKYRETDKDIPEKQVTTDAVLPEKESEKDRKEARDTLQDEAKAPDSTAVLSKDKDKSNGKHLDNT